MLNTQSFCIRILLLITVGLTQCLALKQISVVQGDTLTLTCPIKNTNMRDAVEWRNPDGFLLFFNRHRVLKDKRKAFVTLTASKSSISLTGIKFKDAGVYKCLRYKKKVSTKRYKVIVIGVPKLEMDQQEDKTLLKCSASANEHPPRLSWLMDNGLEIAAHPYYEFENASNKYTAVSQLTLNVPKKRVTVKCLVRHSALHGSELETFIHLGDQSQDTTSSSTTLGSTDTTVIPTVFSNTSFTYSHSASETTNYNNTTVNKSTEETSGRTNILSNTTDNETNKTISETTDGTPSNTSIESSSNNTGNNHTQLNTRIERGNSPLLVLLVTCLIICLFVVLVFFLVRLRKAHIAWKKENEESDQSVESSRSKTSSEEKQKQQQRGQGFCNTNFTKYKAEEALEAQATPTSVVNENPQPFTSRSCIKETEL
ncbi:cytotoxic and regulatory T-cell molecule [Tachysurus fulvidraco]|uniref:cytotoxic and regulatory T-cell molecule n=1 Tax=Tachysurus fulvidraco TaxID=1234273 RepID=UPI000F5059B2|nr:cytotoxic and regulatory T-cell molecule [Tachysurus fulvidraco]